MHSPPASEQPQLELVGSRQLPQWMQEQNVSFAFTTYQTGKLFLIGLQPEGRLSVFERTFNRCMGLWGDGQTLWMSSLYQLWRFENVLEPGQTADGYDRLYVPQVGYTTGDIDIHDVAVDADGRVVFVNTLFGCLATTSETHSFAPLWRPPFVSRLAAEDRCHLNGLALKHGRPRYVTAVSQSDVADGWRDQRVDGGCVVDVKTNEVVATGLSMPHSPRWYRDQLWLLNSGTGFLGTLDPITGKFDEVAFCPGYLRGLSFAGDFAVVALSGLRQNRTFSGLPLDDNLASRRAEPRCGLQVIDLRTGDTAHWLRIEGIVEELYDVIVLPGVRRPQAVGFKTDEIRRMLRVGEEQPL
ncbi:MAG: TIGR03032 family protein [Planctomycetaceae bacterium]